MLDYENPRAVAEEMGGPATGTIGLSSYSEALGWTAMVLTTLGTVYWPRTPEGRVLCLLLALYAFGTFGLRGLPRNAAILSWGWVGRMAPSRAASFSGFAEESEWRATERRVLPSEGTA